MAVQGWTPVTGDSVGCTGGGGAQVRNGDPFYSGDLVSSRRKFQAQKMVELSPGPEGCRYAGSTHSHPLASILLLPLPLPTAATLPSTAQIHHHLLGDLPGLCPAPPATTPRSRLAVEAFPADLLPFSALPGVAVPAQASSPTFAQHGSLPNTPHCPVFPTLPPPLEAL